MKLLPPPLALTEELEVIDIADSDDVLVSAVTDLDTTLERDEKRVIKKLKLAAKECKNSGGQNTILTICMLCVKISKSGTTLYELSN